MLKIKDNVDLKELEKFGFVKCPKSRWEDYILGDDDTEFVEDEIGCEDFYIKNRELIIEGELYGEELEHILYLIFDLIQAGLVEKEMKDE